MSPPDKKEPAKKPAEPKKDVEVNLGSLEEDDEFEEFPIEEWTGKGTDLPIWEDNWDDDNVENDLCTELKEQLEKDKDVAMQ